MVALLSFIAFLSLGGKILVARFLYAVHCGYTRGMVTLTGSNALTVCDLSPLNLASVFWMMHSSFWCFVAALLGLSPAILIGWTVHLAHPVWSVVATGVAILLSIAGLVVSVVALVFILVGCFGAVSFTRKLGAPQLYQLSHQTVLRIDDFVLTIIHPVAPERWLTSVYWLKMTNTNCSRFCMIIGSMLNRSGIPRSAKRLPLLCAKLKRGALYWCKSLGIQ